MNKEEIDEWLDNEYGVSYTRLEELHNFLIEQNMKYQDKIVNLQQENQQLKEKIDKALRKLKSSVNHFRTQRENNAVIFTIRILEGKENEQ